MAEYNSNSLPQSALFLYILFILLVLASGQSAGEKCLYGLHETGPVSDCTASSGDLKMQFCPTYQFGTLVTNLRKPINCTVNKPANISIYFYNEGMPPNNMPKNLLKRNVRGINVMPVQTNCMYSIRIARELYSECQFGTFVCKAVTNQNETISLNATMEYQSSLSSLDRFNFNVEDDELEKSRELIIGTSANLSCEHERRLSEDQFFTFYRVGRDGKPVMIEESRIAPKRYEWQSKLDSRPALDMRDIIEKRRLYIRRIDESDSAIYICSVFMRRDRCTMEKRLHLKTRPCKPGYYCDHQSSKETACEAGTYSNISGLFSKAGCKDCPLHSYCPLASSAPIPCQRAAFHPQRKTRSFVTVGKKTMDDCRRCPFSTPCDKDGDKCSFICGEGAFNAMIGRSVKIYCLLSDGKLLGNLTWYKGGKQISNDSSYSIYLEDDVFSLAISKMSSSDVGDYNCSGVDLIMGNHFYSTVKLTGDHANGSADKVYLPLFLSLAVFVMLCGIVAVIIRRQRQSHYPLANSFDTGSQIEIYPPELRNVLARKPSDDDHHKFDVFICYSIGDKRWVRRTLLPKLQSYSLRVCIDFQDFCPGSFIIENIADAISSSRKTLAVLSPDFVNSSWCQKELMMALTRIEDKHQVIPVMYRLCEVPRFLCQRTYLDWCNEDVRETFWEQLIRTINDGREHELTANIIGNSDVL